jgi:hypothetical protein
MGARASQVEIVSDPRTTTNTDPLPEAPEVPEGASATTDSPAQDAGDIQGTIPSEHITALLTRPRYTEE